MSTDVLFQLGIASVRLNISLTETPQETPQEAPPRCGKPGFGLMARAVRHGRTPPEH